MAETKEMAIYYDASVCTACKGCQIACKQWNQLPSRLDDKANEFGHSFEHPKENTGDTWLHMSFEEGEDSKGNFYWAFGRQACLHCTDAACVNACPTGACQHNDNGGVFIDKDTCIGCEYCVAACPFSVPKLRERDNKSRKCSMCVDRTDNGMIPACVKTCPTDALQFGTREEMVAMAKDRLAAIKPTHPDAMVYGLTEMGGLHVIQVLPFGNEAVRLPKDPKVSALTLVSKYTKPITGLGALAVAAMSAAAFIGGRGYKRGENELSFDPETGITYDDGVPVDEHGNKIEAAAGEKGGK